MDFFLNVEDLYSRKLKRSDLTRFRYDEQNGFFIDAIQLDSILETHTTSLSFEKSIKTDFGYLITWTISAGWIIAPTNKDGKPDFIQYELLDTFLLREYASIQSNQYQTITMKELMINEFIEMLEDHIQVLNNYIMDENAVSYDEIVLIVKEHRNKQTRSIHDLILLLENEVHVWKYLKVNYKNNSYWNLNEIKQRFTRPLPFEVKERSVKYIV